MKKYHPMEQKQSDPPSQEFQNFQNLARKLVSVPKKEVEQQQAKDKKGKPAKTRQ
jgi:hypothetical protein